jgi:hypothetical protein
MQLAGRVPYCTNRTTSAGGLKMDQFEREEEALEEAYNNGEITAKEYNKQMQELQRDYRAAAQEAAQEAYDNEMGRW